MEIHRLKPMQNYDPKLFEDIYNQTKRLRKSLASQIDCRRFGVTEDIVLSWFDDKFIYVFNKYMGKKDPDTLKGYIINSLRTFKYRVLRGAYTQESIEFYGNTIDLEDSPEANNIIQDTTIDSAKEIFLGLATEFIKNRLSQEFWIVFEIQLNPPFYILSRMKDPNSRIPTPLILDYLGLPKTQQYILKINKVRRYINQIIEEARDHFNKKGYELSY